MTVTESVIPAHTTSQTRQAQRDTQDLVAALQAQVKGEVRFDQNTRMLYSTDASLYQIQPVGVVIPKDAEDVQATVEIAARHQVPVLPRGSGSSLAGQAIGAAIIIDFSKYMNTVVEVDPAAKTVTAQPGVSVAVLNRQLGAHKLMLGPDPASADRATVGGSVGNNATGSHSILYGMMADNVIAAHTILADGSTAYFSPVEATALAAKGRSETLEGRIYREVPQLLERIMPDILSRWPKHWRRASGYNLDRLAASLLPPEERSKLSFDTRFRPPLADPKRIDRFNVVQLLTGSEGTLGIMTDVKLSLVDKPTKTALAVVHYDNVVDACASIPDILETDPSASELLDRQLLGLARAQPEWAKKIHFVDGDPAAVLLTEFYGESEKELIGKIEHLEQHLRKRGWKGKVVRVLDSARVNDVWTVRKAGLNILMSRRGDHKPVTGIEDVSVPQEQLADYLRRILDYCMVENDIGEVAVYAHASAGCLHVRPLLNMKSGHDIGRLRAVGEFAADLAVEYSGVMSGEHGDGLARSIYNPRLFGPTLFGAMQETKRIFDPQNLLNPGKIVDTPSPVENLRMGPTYQTIELKTVFDWGSDGGYAPAIEMCNGAGVCRKLGAGTMCPSYMATRDEHDTTRARANALRNAMAGRIPPDELFSPDLYGVMDLCLGCKACKSECPSAVDMAKIKAEYLVHYYQHNGLPLFNRMMGWLPTLNELLFKLPAPVIDLVNWGMGSSAAKRVLSKIGVHPARDLPRYANQSFAQWFATAGPKPTGEAPNGPVVLFHDTWTNYNETQIGEAAALVLAAAGYDVHLATGRKCCGRPLITGGQADKAKPWVDHNVALLAPYAAQGIPIVGIEPSCILTLRDEYLNLASDQARAKLLAGNAFTFEEFVVRAIAASRFQAVWRNQPGKVLLHGHCHQKALVGNDASVVALKAAGYTVEVIASGCCGMAGDFGYERDHYEVSQRIGEDRLMPAVRAAAPDTIIVASGTSCRHQIHDFAERQPLHMAEALAAALA
ncbi:MAG: FAD-binding protein [Caldilineaceae bacterium]|nr:FAD-binding protein [Caldilineaceae bacterium]